MNRLGIIVDVSHVSDDTFWDVVKVSKAPIIASHSNARALADHVRNMDDDMLRAVAGNDGVVMVNFMTIYLDPEKMARWKLMGWHWFTHPRQPETPLSLLIDHIDHIVQVAGIDHVGLGSDFDNTPFLPEGLKDVGDYPNLTVELVRRGYSDWDIRKILGGNVLRVLADVEAVATQP
jgi:membrane dipeptidase